MLKAEEMHHQILIQRDTCPECGSSNLVEDYDMGEIVCGTCGVVIYENILNEGPEWRAFTRQETEKRSRVGTPTSLSLHDKGLSTVIDRVNKDALGRRLPSSTRLQMLRLRKWHLRAKVDSSVDRNLAQAMAELDRLTDKIVVPSSVKEQAAFIYRKALGKRLVRGRSILSIVAASLYAACRITGTSRNIRDIIQVSSRDRKEVTRCYRLILRELGLKMPIDDPVKFVPRIASKVGLDQKTQNKAIKILQKAKKLKFISGKDPAGIAAAALYIAAFPNAEKTTQKHLAEAAEVTEVTIRNRYRRLVKDLGLSIARAKKKKNEL